ncbi:MAG: N-acetyltransferase [Hyphomicrobiales bacterium]|nr:MAG: N-acetyltransferase [Hyphomicrobiales bacterium]
MADTLTAEIIDATSGIDASVWNGLVAASDSHANPFLDHAFFLALEQSGCATARTGWSPRHILLRDGTRPIGLMPMFEKTHSQGEYVFDHGWANAFEQAGGAYYPKLQAAVPFTPVTAPKLLTASGDIGAQQALLGAAANFADRRGISSIHATFVPEAETAIAPSSDWLVRTDTQYHWHNAGFATFEGYLETLSSRHRKVTRRERREALEGLSVKWLTGADLTEGVWDAFFDFYQDTGNRKWGRPYLNREFFSLLSEAMADRIVLMLAYEGETPIAGTLNMLGKDTLYGRYWGASREVPFLHFELCYYQAIDFAIEHKLATVEAGAQGEHKLARGYAPATTYSMHWIGHPGLRDAVARFLRQERAAVAREQEMLNGLTPFKHST